MATKYKPLPYQQSTQSARNYFVERGICIQHWAEAMGFKLHNVKDVLYGHNKGTYGAGHEIAVALGIKRKPQE